KGISWFEVKGPVTTTSRTFHRKALTFGLGSGSLRPGSSRRSGRPKTASPSLRATTTTTTSWELLIPELPRGVLTTVNTKTDFNLDDPDWTDIFAQLNQLRPRKQIREQSQTELRKKWLQMLRATNPEDTVSDEVSVWPTGTSIDVYR